MSFSGGCTPRGQPVPNNRLRRTNQYSALLNDGPGTRRSFRTPNGRVCTGCHLCLCSGGGRDGKGGRGQWPESTERKPVPAPPADSCVSRSKTHPKLNLSSPLHYARRLGHRICKLKSLDQILLLLLFYC